MRPIKLNLQNFGPFKSEVIDFSAFHGKMFLLTGPTGSGKSMIFNAILYGLYGSDSRHKTLRSQFASEDEKSVVTLEFEMGNKSYVVERTMTIHREDKSDVPPKALLMFKNGETIASGMKLVNEAVLDIIHLNEHQFKQILLLPQGAFKDFLVSSSDEKSKILSTIFNAERFIYFEKSLEKEMKAERVRIEQLYVKLEHIFSQVKYKRLEEDELDVLFEEANGIEKQLEFIEHVNVVTLEKITALNDAIETLSKEIDNMESSIKKREQHNESVNAYNALIKEKERLDSEKSQIELLQEKIKQHQDAQLMKYQLETYDKLTHSLVVLKKNRETIEKENQQMTVHIDALKEQREKLNAESDTIQSYETYIQQTHRFFEDETYQNIDVKVREMEAAVESSQKRLESEQTNYEDLENKRDKLLVTDDQESKLESEHAEAIKTVESLKQQLKYREATRDIDILDEKIGAQESRAKEIRDSMVGKQSSQDQAAIEHLMSHLSAGDACPVCQQIVSALPEHQFYDSETEHSLKEIRETIENLNRARVARVVERDIIKQNIDGDIELTVSDLEVEFERSVEEEDKVKAALKELKERRKSYYETLDMINQSTRIISELTSHSNQEKNELSQSLTRRDEFVNVTKETSYESFINIFNERKETIDSHYKLLKENEEKTQSSNQSHTIGVERLRHLLSQLEKVTAEESELKSVLIDYNNAQNIESIEQLRQLITDDMSSVKTRVKEFKDTYDTLSIKINTHIDNETTVYQEIQDEEREALKSLKDDQTYKIKQITLLNNDIEQNNQLVHEIDELGKTIKTDIEAFQGLHRIYEVIAGKGGHGISLHRFVLTYHLDRVLVHANIRLGDMTNGRYTLIRTNEANRKGTAAGLEIRVNDSFSGRTRHVDTLSGGETFQASLALALAINEIIIQSSGGIQLDTILIDEGFGTLDQETLNQAIESLLSLEMSGKMVGVISHVEELKHRLEYKIEVIPNNDTSTTKLHF